jgi:diacylglycerol kinase (ATP)
MKKCVVILNPNSGKKKKYDVESEFKSILNENGYDVSFEYTRYSGHAKVLVKELSDDIDLVISLGGDGTFNEVMSGNFMREKRLLLSHIPFGTTNDIGAMYGMGKDPVANLKAILSGTVKKLDICKINDQPFVYVAGLGKFVNVAYDTPRKLKKKFGYLAYLINGVRSFNHKTKLFKMTYEVDGEEVTGLFSLVLIGNASRIAGLNFFQDVKLDDNQFEVLLSNFKTRTDLAKGLYYFKTSDINRAPGFSYFKTSHLKIKLDEVPRKSWCLDGEEYTWNSREFDITIDRDVHMLLPNKKLDKLFVNKG